MIMAGAGKREGKERIGKRQRDITYGSIAKSVTVKVPHCKHSLAPSIAETNGIYAIVDPLELLASRAIHKNNTDGLRGNNYSKLPCRLETWVPDGYEYLQN
jgi:hypothetical protein